MTSDPNKKTSRTFQCKDALWHKFEQMAEELECSVDYLVNDAMKQYARQRGYHPAATISQPPHATNGSAVATESLSPALSSLPPVPQVRTNRPVAASPVPPLPPPMSRRPTSPTSGLPPPAPPLRRTGAPPLAPTPRRPPPPLTRTMPQSPVARAAAPPPPPVPRHGTGTLTVLYQGAAFPVSKDRFIIGRGKQSSDLTIRDPNVSRQHAMVEFLNGQYYIVDMGSTNGIEYNGQRVQRKVIHDGDRFRVCDHELSFSFH